MKRKYTRKALQSKSRGIKRESSIKLPPTTLPPTTLPPDVLASIEKVLEHRKALGIFDDRGERIERALRYQGFIKR